MEKRVLMSLLLLVILFSLLPIISAQEETDEIEKAYSCLESKLGDDCGNTKSTEQTAFSLLAIAHKTSLQADCKSSLENKKQNNCWGSTSTANCDLKSTSQATLALDNVGKNVDDYVDWLLNKRKLTTDLNWFLEIDANEATACKIDVNGGAESTFTINENKKFGSEKTTCLEPSDDKYFLDISNTCYDDNFTISCDKDFITTLLYKKPGEDIYYVSSKTHSASAEGSTREKVESYCFTTATDCDYGGSLWAALALAKTGKEISNYLPYLSSMSDEEDNKEYFPSAFLYMLTDEDDYYTEVTEKQKQGKYWQEKSGSLNINYYDTALALLSLQNLVLEGTDNAKNYLLEKQDDSGCWNSDNIRDTSFILYAWEQKTPVITNGDGRSDCEQFGHYCVSPGQCTLSNTLDNFYCPGLSEICCGTQPEEQTCYEKQGIICEADQECTGSEVMASDTNYCCLASCIAVTTEEECEDYGYTCKSSCEDDEDEKLYDCSFGEVCCGKKEKQGNWLLVFLLIILIILVVLAIIFRNQLKIWWFRFKSKLRFGKPPGPGGRPALPLTTPPLLQRPRQIIPRPMRPIRRRLSARPAPRRTPKDTIFDETMRKLREMSK